MLQTLLEEISYSQNILIPNQFKLLKKNFNFNYNIKTTRND